MPRHIIEGDNPSVLGAMPNDQRINFETVVDNVFTDIIDDPCISRIVVLKGASADSILYVRTDGPSSGIPFWILNYTPFVVTLKCLDGAGSLNWVPDGEIVLQPNVEIQCAAALANLTVLTANDKSLVYGSLPEAPIDGSYYARLDGSWTPFSPGGMTDAPSDGIPYSRKDAQWLNFVDTKPRTFLPTAITVTGFTANASNSVAKIGTIDNNPNCYVETASGAHTIDIDIATGQLNPITHIICRMRYIDGTATPAHTIDIKIWDTATSAYSASLQNVIVTPYYQYVVIPLYGTTIGLIDGVGTVKVRLEHVGTVVAGHVLDLDYVAAKINWTNEEQTSDPLPAGRFLGVQTLTSGTTYTPSSGVAFVRAVGVAAGGGGGGATAATSNCSVGGGGASGGSFEHWFPVANIRPCTIALGTAGTAGATNNGTGGTGGNTTLAVPVTDVAIPATITAYGGLGGGASGSGTTVTYGDGGAAGVLTTNAHIKGSGTTGMHGFRVSGTAGMSGEGASSIMGRGGSQVTAAGAGTAGTGYGSGGSGGMSTSATGSAGGAGTAGCIVFYEFT